MINKYPYTDFNEYNLDWVITHMKDLIEEWAKTKTEWADMETEFADLKNYIENLDLQDEVNQKLDEMAEDGTLEALMLPYLASIVNPSKTIEISRTGRFLDEFRRYTRNAVLLGQDCFYYDGYYYECGNISNTSQAISVWDYDGQLVNYKNDYTDLEHASGIAVDATHIYIACAHGTKKIAIINKDDLSVSNLITFPTLGGSIEGITNYNNDIYFINTATIDGVSKFCLNLYDKDNETYQEIAQLVRPVNTVLQGGMCMVNNKVYIIMNRSNMIYRYPLTGGDPDYMYYIPDGDGLWPCGECEGLVVKDGDIYIYSMYYDNENIASTIFTNFTQLFKTDILHPLQKTDPLSYDRYMGVLEFSCDSTATYSFNPKRIVTTLEELSALANYHQSSTLHIYDTNAGKLYLHDCECAIDGISGSREITILESVNANLNINTISDIGKMYLQSSEIIADNVNLTDTLDVYRSSGTISLSYLGGLDTFNIVRSHIKIVMPKSLNSAITYTAANQAENILEYIGQYYSGILKFFECVIGSGTSSTNVLWFDAVAGSNYGFQDRLTRTNIINSNGGTSVTHPIVNNSYYSHIVFNNGNIYGRVSGTDTELSDGTLIDAIIKR